MLAEKQGRVNGPCRRSHRIRAGFLAALLTSIDKMCYKVRLLMNESSFNKRPWADPSEGSLSDGPLCIDSVKRGRLFEADSSAPRSSGRLTSVRNGNEFGPLLLVVR
jgi:hypothetical protein